jgi:hypothetical protein
VEVEKSPYSFFESSIHLDLRTSNELASKGSPSDKYPIAWLVAYGSMETPAAFEKSEAFAPG